MSNAPSDHGKMIGTSDVNEEEETDEVAVVEVSNAVVDPGAVMVCAPHSFSKREATIMTKMNSPIRSTQLVRST